MVLLEILYALVVILLAVYGFNTLLLTWISTRQGGRAQKVADSSQVEWPWVSVQLPIYNERYVAERLIQAVVKLDYPRDRLEIQVLDDSTDSTAGIVAQNVAMFQRQGVDIQHIRRQNRYGYKSGALAFGMQHAKGEYLAIFDADFVPQPDFLKSCIPHLIADPTVGCLQARWGHINRHTSWLTRSQATGIDGHFQIEQKARSASGFFLNFNGTAGIWRRECICHAGGWQSDTLTEDLDLSYRAQLKKWRILYLPHVTVPAELPVHISAFKRQQFRWAKGSLQTARKMLPRLWRSEQPLRIKLEGTIHTTHYLVHLLILMNLLLTLPVLYLNSRFYWAVHILTTAAVGPLLMYWISMRSGGQSIRSSLTHLVMLLFLGMGLSVNNSRAALEALFGIQTGFLRTPKFNITKRETTHDKQDYILPRDTNTVFEIGFVVYTLILLGFVIKTGAFGLVLWLVLYAGGFAYIVYLGWVQSKKISCNPGDIAPAAGLNRVINHDTSSQPSGD